MIQRLFSLFINYATSTKCAVDSLLRTLMFFQSLGRAVDLCLFSNLVL